MSGDYLIPANEVRMETKVANSLFVGAITPVFSVEEAKAFIARIKTEFPDATHHVPAYLIGYGASVIAHSSDDGEPSGTAGRPALSVLQGSGLGDVAVVVTRYFGGTKLGTGGLVRAYTEAVKLLVAEVPKARRVLLEIYQIELPYSLYDRVQLLIEKLNGEVISREFLADVRLTIGLDQDKVDPFRHEILEYSSGQVSPQFIDTQEFIKPAKTTSLD
jgi:uncharacterized YigZ family protein